MDRGAWQAAAHGVAESRTRLKRLSTRAQAIQNKNFFFKKQNTRKNM